MSRTILFADTECDRDLRGRLLHRHSFRGQRILTSLGKITDCSWDITFRQDRTENRGRNQKHERCVKNVSIQEAMPLFVEGVEDDQGSCQRCQDLRRK